MSASYHVNVYFKELQDTYTVKGEICVLVVQGFLHHKFISIIENIKNR